MRYTNSEKNPEQQGYGAQGETKVNSAVSADYQG